MVNWKERLYLAVQAHGEQRRQVETGGVRLMGKPESKTRTRGMALITTLMVMTLLLTLVGAFVTVNGSASRLTSNALQRRKAQDAALTALHIAWQAIEKQSDFATPSGPFFPNSNTLYPAGNPIARVRGEVRNIAGQNTYFLVGEVNEDGDFDSPLTCRFSVAVYNHLRSRSMDISGVYPRSLTYNETIPVPARSIRLVGEARCGITVRRLDTILRQKALTYSSMTAGRDANVGLSASRVRLESRDPFVNQIAARRNLSLPNANAVQFLQHGTARSGQDLNSGGVNLANDDAARLLANQASGGLYQAGNAPQAPPTFDPEKFRLPTEETDIASGEYEFGGIDYVEYRPQDILWENTVTDPVTGSTTTVGGSVTRYQRATSTYDQLRGADGRIWVARDARADSLTLDPPTVPTDPVGDSVGDAMDWGYGPGSSEFEGGAAPTGGSDVYEIYPGFFANVVTAQMAIRSGKTVKAPGDVVIKANGDRPPEMLFGYQFTPGGVAVQESLRDGIEAAKETPENYMAALQAGGTVDIPGGVIGYGSLVAGGDMTLKASHGLRTAPELGVLVKARNLTINPASEPEPHLPGEPVKIDYPVFREAINSFAGSDWSSFDSWLSQTSPQRQTTVQGFRGTSLSGDASTYWNQLNTELGTSFALPSLPGGWGGNINVEQYVRLKEFIQTLASGYNQGQGDATWLDLSQHQHDAAARLENMVSSMSQWAKSYQVSLRDYLNNPDPGVPDMFYQGLLYADQELRINADGRSFRLEGAMLSGLNTLLNAARIDLVYDRSLIDDQLDLSSGSKLEKIYFTLQ